MEAPSISRMSADTSPSQYSVICEEQSKDCHNSLQTSLTLYLCPVITSQNETFFSWLYSLCRTLAAPHIGGFLSYLDMVGLFGWVISPSQGLYLHRRHNTERRGKTFMPWVGFEPMIPATNRPRPMPQTARPLWPARMRPSCTNLCVLLQW
jgi:hypothetical protein